MHDTEATLSRKLRQNREASILPAPLPKILAFQQSQSKNKTRKKALTNYFFGDFLDRLSGAYRILEALPPICGAARSIEEGRGTCTPKDGTKLS
jgi:hypothetical protein